MAAFCGAALGGRPSAGACLIAACGDDSGGGRLLSSGQASDLRSTLSKVEQDVADGDCTGAGQEVATLQSAGRLDLAAGPQPAATRCGPACAGSRRWCATQCDTTTTAPAETTPTTPDEGPTGATGTTGSEGDQEPPPDEKKPKKDKSNQGKDGQTPPGQQNEGGGAGLPGESNSNGSGD